MTIMKILLCIFLLVILVITPVLGFTADSLEIDVREEGGAQVAFTYSLSWYERFAIFLQIANPTEEVKKAVESLMGQPVTIQEVSSNSVVFSVYHFASVHYKNGSRVFVTPELQFPNANMVLQQYWFAPFVQADFSPARTTIRFPDGKAEIWTEEEIIPTVTHEEPRFLTAELVC